MEERTTESAVCYRHPDRATRLACSECGRPICVECSNDAAVGQKCPECSRPSGRHQVINAGRALQARPGFDTAPVTFSIISVAAVIFFLGFVSPQADRWLVENLAQVNRFISEGQWWRILTAAWLHGSVMHILFNMYALYLFGPRLEREVGSVPFAGLYLASAAAGSAASYLFGPEIVQTARGPVLYTALGASGAIFGLFGAWIYVAFKLRATPAGKAMFNQLGVLLLINLALPLLVPNIDWRAHVGGLVGGITIAWLWSSFAVGKPNARAIRTSIAAAVLVAAILAVTIL